jgi:putative membrane protein
VDLAMYEILKILHIVSFVSWFAGLFYLPRLFVYHVENNTNREMNDIFQKMEYKLLRVIMNPAMILTWIFGLGLIHYVGFAGWLVLKIILVIILSGFHMYLAKIRKNLEHNYRDYSSRYLRLINEVPTILLILIVILVVVKPF